MDDHTPMPSVSRLEVITTGARRRWTLSEKLRIVAESHSGHRTASATARRHGLSTSQLFGWRKLAREGRLGTEAATGFAAAVVVPDRNSTAEPVASTPGVGRMEIMIGPARIIVDATVDAAALARVLAVLARR
jgi:transposase